MCLLIIPSPHLSFSSYQKMVNYYFSGVKLTSQVTIGFFHIIVCWRLIQTKNIIMKFITLIFLRVLNNSLKNSSFCSCVKTVWLGVSTLHIFVTGWAPGGDSGFVPDIAFYLVNTIPNAWSSYLISYPLRLVHVANHTDRTRTKGLSLLVNYLGIQFTPKLFSTVSFQTT